MRDVRGQVSRAVEGSAGRLGDVTAAAEATWADRGSRWLAIVGGTSLWFAAAFQDMVFLVPFVAGVAGLWWRRRKREPVAEDVDDWY